MGVAIARSLLVEAQLWKEDQCLWNLVLSSQSVLFNLRAMIQKHQVRIQTVRQREYKIPKQDSDCLFNLKRRVKQEASMVVHSLQLVAEEFRKIHKLKIANLRWIIRQCHASVQPLIKGCLNVQRECRLPNLKALQLIKDYTCDNARSVVEFYLDT